MDLGHLNPETRDEIDTLLRETEAKMGAMLKCPVNITMLVHPIHTDNEPCQGTAVISAMTPPEIMTSIMYAGITVDRLLKRMLLDGPKPTIN